jgi:K(+)-stimulated pyrophosphate-energized sodium pump
MNILIKLMSIVSLVIAPYIAEPSSGKNAGADACCEQKMEAACGEMGKCDMSLCATMTKEECAAHCDSVGCSAEEKAHCMSMYGEDGKYIGGKCDMQKCKSMTAE